LFDFSSFITIYLHFQTLKTPSKTWTDFGGEGQIGCAATGDCITIVHLARRAKQAAHLDFEFSETSAEPICDSSLLKWDLPILCKFDLGLEVV